MYLKNLSLLNYKNIVEANYGFDPKINCFVGRNGVGKTNVLDAIYHLAYGKSYFNPQAVQNIRHGEEFFVIDGSFDKNGRDEQIVCSLKKGQKKVIKRNNKLYDKFSEHIGFIPLVIISPSDADLIAVLHFWRYAVLIIVLLAAIITPTPDPYNQVLVAGPMFALYFVGIGLAYLLQPKRPRGQTPA